MSGLFTSLQNTVGALNTYTKVLEVMQNNIANASTQGYAKQIARLEAMPFDLAGGLPGGVTLRAVNSARDAYAEQSVRRETTSLGASAQQAQSLKTLESIFSISPGSGLPHALNQLFESFSAWAQLPGDGSARQNVIDRATDLAAAFNQTASSLSRVTADATQQLRETVSKVNYLTERLAEFRQSAMASRDGDPGLDARIHAALEELSEYAPITVLEQSDGSMTVLLNGQVPLVSGARSYPLELKVQQPEDPPPVYADAPPAAYVYAGSLDVTGAASGGRLGALLDFRNRTLPGINGDARQQGDLNAMAQQIADRINEVLESGQLSEGPPPVSGEPLFVYDETKPGTAAATLALNPAVALDSLAAVDPGPPAISNGIPLRLARLASPDSDDDRINGESFTQFYGRIAGRIGSELSAATDEQAIAESTVAQAKSLRAQVSGVSLDEEAMVLVEFQRAYQANARVLTALDEMLQQIINTVNP